MTDIPFTYEDDLCAVLGRHAADLLAPPSNSGYVLSFEQLQVANVIPDFVLVRRAVSMPKSRRSRALTSIEAAVVATLLRGRPLRSETIARRLYSAIDRLEPHLLSLERSGIIEQTGSGAFTVPDTLFPQETEVIAIEAKLHRWSDAVRQAAGYLKFANETYVALPESIARDNSALARAAAVLGIGVLSVSLSGVQVVRRARRQSTRSADWVWLLSRTSSRGPADALPVA